MGVKEQMEQVIESFVTNMVRITKDMALAVLWVELTSSQEQGEPVNVGNFDPALEIQPAVTKAADRAKRTAKKIAKRTVKRVKKTVAKANAELVANEVPSARQRRLDRKKAWRLNEKQKNGKDLTDEQLNWLVSYEAMAASKREALKARAS